MPNFSRMQISALVNWRVAIGALLVSSLLMCVLLSLLWATRKGSDPASLPTAVLSVIGATQLTPPSPTVSATAMLTETLSALPSPQPGLITVGAYVQITGTGGDGLRLRSEPGLAGQVLLLGSEAEVFLVKDGPKEIDGYTWWYLVGPFDSTRFGWAVANFLSLIQGP